MRRSLRLATAVVGLTIGCGPQPRVATVAQALRGGEPVGKHELAVTGRAENVRFFQPERGSSGITFRLTDGTGSIQVVHEGTLHVLDGQMVQVHGELVTAPGQPPQLRASRIWILSGARAP